MTKSIKDFTSEATIANRLSGNELFNGVVSATQKYNDFLGKIDGVPMDKVSATDKQTLFKKLEQQGASVDKEMSRVADRLMSSMAVAEANYKAMSTPTSQDYALAGLMAGKSGPELMEMGYKSPAAARLLTHSDAGAMAGLDSKQLSSLAPYTAPDHYQAVQDIKSQTDTLIKLKGTGDQAHSAVMNKFQVSATDKKVFDALSSED
ncbi:hypothetical protein [Vibrio breoganii]|uniref:hypothetical protein n=1 Tax=Vibrio breoganii TaxID=553239 RepID=UPI000C8153FA|nr:hypothetical protein [Vibrio breoganii]PMG98927.1 hypothetical protein BCU80_03225 [Vibrio breoganii]PMK34087.1 hypothetical protein BCU06_00390 [Vibrio breoganii]PML54568.1 hypothetical protein BCT73_15465 [Vibrio breoganii]PMO81350.1 hypothetical protein BCT00_11675 [Vibrio breoganii]